MTTATIGILDTNPYPGARPIQYGEPIHGRSRELAELRSLLIARRIVLLYSPSGAGKSSLVNAGLRPELEQRGFHVLPTVRVGSTGAVEGPARNPYALSTIDSLEEGRPENQKLTADELATISLAEYFTRITADGADDPCFVFDQFEELFTLDPTDVEAKRAFLTELGVALRDEGRWALFAMREDYVAQLDPFLDLLPTDLATRYRLDLLTHDPAMDAVRLPAASRGVLFTQEAARTLIDDLSKVKIKRGNDVIQVDGPYVEPVQLQVVCRRLWSTERADQRQIGLDDVRRLGSVDQALADFYVDAVRQAVVESGVSEREIRDWIDTELITEQGFRAQASEGPGNSGAGVLRLLENAHLLRAEQRRGTLWYELSHDRLLVPVRESNDAWRTEHLSPFQQAAQAWVRAGRPLTGMAMTGAALADARAWRATQPQPLPKDDDDYFALCEAEEQRLELERQGRELQVKVARRNRLLAIAAGIVAVVAVLGLVVTILFWRQANEAKRDAETSEQRAVDALAAQQDAERKEAEQRAAREQTDAAAAWRNTAAEADDTRTQLLSWLAAFRVKPDDLTPEQRRQLSTAEHYLRHDPLHLGVAVALDAAGTTMARTPDHGGVELVDVNSLVRRPLVDGPERAVALAFSPNDARLAIAGTDSIAIWDSAAATQLRRVDSVEASIDALSFGNRLVGALTTTASGPGPILLWDASTLDMVEPPPGIEAASHLALGASSDTLVVVEGSTVRAWSRENSTWVAAFEIDVDVPATGALTVSPDGSLVAIALDPVPEKGALRLVDAVSGDGVDEFVGDGAASPIVTAVAFLPDQKVRWVDELGTIRTATIGTLSNQSASFPSEPAGFVGGHETAQVSGDGQHVLVGAGDPPVHAVYRFPSRILVGRFVAREGAVGDGRSVAVSDSSPFAADEQRPGERAWTRDVEPQVQAAAVSEDGAAVYLTGTGQVVADGQPGAAPGCEPVPPALDVEFHLAAATGAVAVGPAGDRFLCVSSGGEERSRPQPLPGEVLRALALAPGGTHTITGTELLGAGSVTVYDAEGTTLYSDRFPAPVTAVATLADARVIAAGDERGNVAVIETGANDSGCSSSVPRAEQVVAIGLGVGSDGSDLLAVATATSVYVYRWGAGAPCALEGGFDLLRDEGSVLDLAFGADGALTVLESDLFVYEFDPLAGTDDVAAAVQPLLAARGWALDDGECQQLVGRACP